MKYWRQVCAKAEQTPADDEKKLKSFFEQNFQAYAVTEEDKSEGIFTGYYIPEISASLTSQGRFIYPIYRLPPPEYLDLTRKAIDAGGLAGRELELAFTDDPVGLFFLQVQGTGVLRFGADEKMLIGFAGKNHQEYRAIGPDLLAAGVIERPVTMAKIRQWLDKNPGRQREVMEKNPSYIFFKQITDGKVQGASGAALVPGYSLAIDSDKLPYGAPLWLETSLPNVTAPFRRLMVAADTGSAIKGAVRGDIFFGAGLAAEQLAGEMQAKGKYYIFLPVENNAPPEK